MTNKKVLTLAGISLFVIILAVLLLKPFNPSHRRPPRIDPGFARYVSAFTAGRISAGSAVRIVLAKEITQAVEFDKPIEVKLFDFHPSVKGRAYWVDKRTIEFRPDEKLSPGRSYTVRFQLSKVMEVPRNLGTFRFGFETIRQSFAILNAGLSTYDNGNLELYKIEGDIRTADIMENKEAENLLRLEYEGHSPGIRWQHGPEANLHHFVVDSIRRGNEAKTALLKWDGSALNNDAKGEQKLEIPALGDFRVLEVRVAQFPEKYISVRFSDPLQLSQNLDGIISVGANRNLNFVIGNNDLRIYLPDIQSGNAVLMIEPGVKNIRGYTLEAAFSTNITFEQNKPAVRLVGQGVILPNSDGLVFPFEAVNLSTVDLRIIKIFENNVAQFLQVNDLGGNYELYRVGRVVLKKKIVLASDKIIDYGKWNRFTVDLTGLISRDPGAVYRVELGFRKEYSLYPCEGKVIQPDNLSTVEKTNEKFEEEVGYFGGEDDVNYYGDEYFDYYGDDYDWNQRDNPCNSAYYTGKKVARNILASDLGLIAKKGKARSMTFMVTDLKTTQPVPGVRLEVFDFQHQLIQSTRSDAQGFATVSLHGKPYLLVASKGKQRGYLKLDDGSSLSLSMFDVSGEVVQKGIKGFIYGERGVWRPGDSLFLTFILEDKNKLLPELHPVSFDLLNPQGQTVRHLVSTEGVNGFYNFSTATDPDAPTGNWTAKVSVGGAVYTQRIKIETIKPNRLKISLDFGVQTLRKDQAGVSGRLTLKWLHGAIAKNLKASVSVTLRKTNTSFNKYPDFVFDDPSREFSSEEKTIYEGRVNELGEAQVTPEIRTEKSSPGMLRADFIIKAFEESGDFSIDQFSLPYAPYESFIGIRIPKGDKYSGMLVTDTTHYVEVATVDAGGKPVSHQNLEFEVFKVNWRWWWNSSDNDLADYMSREEHEPVLKKVFTTVNGKARVGFRINRSDWGRYLVRVTDPASGHSAGKTIYIDWPYWARREQSERPGGATMLTFTSDKTTYKVGETATVTIPTGGTGRALVSIESGSRVIQADWLLPNPKETVYQFKVTPEMSPNIYVNITLIQPHAQTVNDLPIRLYGVIPLMVEDPGTVLHPVLRMPDVLEPEKDFTLTVKEQQGKAMTYTIAMVDEGLLDLTRFKTPDPLKSFYAREALGVMTWDMFDQVIGAFGGKLGQLLSIGGDEEGGKKGKPVANRFKPMVKFLGPFELKAGTSRSHKISIPQYIGSVRTMIIAGQNSAYGSAEKTTPVKKALMVLSTLPRVLGPGETVKLPVTVFAMDKKIREVKVEIFPDQFLIPKNGRAKAVSFKQTGDKVVEFDLNVAKRIGIARIKVKATCGTESAETETELEVRNPNPKITNYLDGYIDQGSVREKELTFPGMEGTNTGTLEVSCIPPIDFGRRLQYLLQYPYGCIEQTTSAAFPQLYLGNVMELTAEMKERTEKNIRAALNRLRSFQLPSGGFSYWPGEGQASEWAGNYAGHFMLEAEALGYELPSGIREGWLRYQRTQASGWTWSNTYYHNDFIQAYRLYTLALARNPDLAAMNRLRESKQLSLQGKWRLAAAYALSGQPEAATAIASRLGADIPEYMEMGDTYGSDERDLAMILEAMIRMKMKDKAIPLVKKLSEALSGNSWMSTQTTAYCLLALAKFAPDMSKPGKFSFSYSINNGKPLNINSLKPVFQVQLPVKGMTKCKAAIRNTGAGPIYIRMTAQGIPETGDQTSAENNLKLDILYKDMKGNIIDEGRIEQGTDFMAEITVRNPGRMGYYKELAVNEIVPSGWEILNSRLWDLTPAQSGDVPGYQDIRDDRIYTFFDLGAERSKTFRIMLNASYLGRFFLPTLSCEAMYDNRINARKPGKWVEVVKSLK